MAKARKRRKKKAGKGLAQELSKAISAIRRAKSAIKK